MSFYDKRSHTEILSNLRPPKRFCTTAAAAAEERIRRDDDTMSDLGSTTDTVVAALQTEMAMNAVMRQQLHIFWSVSDAGSLAAFRARCEDQGVPVDIPVP